MQKCYQDNQYLNYFLHNDILINFCNNTAESLRNKYQYNKPGQFQLRNKQIRLAEYNYNNKISAYLDNNNFSFLLNTQTNIKNIGHGVQNLCLADNYLYLIKSNSIMNISLNNYQKFTEIDYQPKNTVLMLCNDTVLYCIQQYGTKIISNNTQKFKIQKYVKAKKFDQNSIIFYQNGSWYYQNISNFLSPKKEKIRNANLLFNQTVLPYNKTHIYNPETQQFVNKRALLFGYQSKTLLIISLFFALLIVYIQYIIYSIELCKKEKQNRYIQLCIHSSQIQYM